MPRDGPKRWVTRRLEVGHRGLGAQLRPQLMRAAEALVVRRIDEIEWVNTERH